MMTDLVVIHRILILEHVSSTIIIMMQHHFVMQAPGNYHVVEIIMKIYLSS